MIIELKPSMVYVLESGLEEFYEEGFIAGDADIDRFCNFWEPIIENKIGVIFCDMDRGEPLGAIAGLVSPDIYDGVLVATEFFLYVRKGNRGSLGVRLLKRFEKWAKNKGARRIRLSARECLPEAKDLFKALGYEHEESIYFKEVK